jgi:transcriptional regulator with XRE-family HTH domain
MDSRGKMEFPSMCRQLRMARHETQATVAGAMGIKPSTYGNMESQNFKVVRIERVQRLAHHFGLDESRTADLVAAWQALPVSEYSTKQKATWERRNAYRSKARNYDRMRDALASALALLVTSVPDPNSLCICSFDGSTFCELCECLRLLGLKGWTTLEEVIKELAALQDKLGDTGKEANGGG